MNNFFGQKLKDFRENKFPGKSLRRVSEDLGLGESFYSYLSKIESGNSLPSEQFLKRILTAYELSSVEYSALLLAYTQDKLQQKLTESGLIGETNTTPQPIRQFLRKVKKNKPNESKSPKKL